MHRGFSPSAGARIGLAGALALCALVVVARLIAIRVCPIYDDAFITYRYAANLAHGHGLVYEPGAEWEPVLGTSTPGYALWLAAWIRLGVSAPVASLVTNVLCDLVTAGLILRALGDRPVAAALAVAGFACMPEIGRISAGGMETPMLAAVVLAAACALESGRPRLAALACAFAGALRPEAALFAATMSLAAWRRGEARRFLPPLVLAGGAYLALLSIAYGSPIPQSVIAKAARHSATVGPAFESILRQAFLPQLAYAPALFFVALGLPRVWRAPPALAHAVHFAAAIVVSYLVARPHTWGWYYYVPLLAWVLALAVGAERVLGAVLRARWSRVERAAPFAAAALGVVAVWAGARGRADRVTERVYRPLQEWARSADLRTSGARVLASDIGAIGYYTGAEILDTEGLVWPQATESHGSQVEWIVAHAPEYLWITATHAKVAALAASPSVFGLYRPVLRFSATGASDRAPDPDELPEEWTQDYILYERASSRRPPAPPRAPATTSPGSPGSPGSNG